MSLAACGCLGHSPTAPSRVAPPDTWTCERMLTHPIRQTYVDRCVHDRTGAVEIRDVVNA